jgi:hypothetical protein
VQEAVGIEADDPTARRELFQQESGALLFVVRIDHAEDLGAARGQLDPRGVRPPGQGGGHRASRHRACSGCAPPSPIGPVAGCPVEPTTRTPCSSRIRRYRRAIVCSETPRTSAIRLNGMRPSR